MLSNMSEIHTQKKAKTREQMRWGNHMVINLFPFYAHAFLLWFLKAVWLYLDPTMSWKIEMLLSLQPLFFTYWKLNFKRNLSLIKQWMIHLSEPHTLKIPLAKKSKHSYLSLVKVRGGWFWSQNHIMAWVGRELWRSLTPNALPWAGITMLEVEIGRFPKKTLLFLQIWFTFSCGGVCVVPHMPSYTRTYRAKPFLRSKVVLHHRNVKKMQSTNKSKAFWSS